MTDMNETPHVRVVFNSWVNGLVGGGGTGDKALLEKFEPNDTVQTVLKRVSRQHPELNRVLWSAENRNELGEHLEVIVNQAILGIHHHLDSFVQPGDEILLAGQYIGG